MDLYPKRMTMESNVNYTVSDGKGGESKPQCFELGVNDAPELTGDKAELDSAMKISSIQQGTDLLQGWQMPKNLFDKPPSTGDLQILAMGTGPPYTEDFNGKLNSAIQSLMFVVLQLIALKVTCSS